VGADLAGLAGDDDHAGGFQQWPGVGAHAARDELVDAQPDERFRPKAGSIWSWMLVPLVLKAVFKAHL